MTPTLAQPRTDVLSAAVPIAAAIGVFGIVYGAAAGALLGPWLTVASSLIVFSGVAQFTMVALVAAGATPLAVLGTVAALALRHLPLGAVLQPVLTASRGRRALVSLFLLDETTGLAHAADGRAERTLAISGGLAYTSWVAGTIAGMGGGSIAAVEPLAAALFPVLFVGLSALTSTTRSDVGRAVLAGSASLGFLVVWPSSGALGAIAIAVVVSCVVRS